MAVNKNALIRYKTIDKCLQNRYRKWTLEDLIYECSEALYEYEGIDKGVSKRTVQADIQIMRSDKLGYNAPIIVEDKKYYSYEEADYSITNIPLSDQDLGKLSEAVQFLKQFQGFSHFKELGSMVQKLEDHIYSQKTNQQSVIDFEKNIHLKGIEFLDPLYKAIINKQSLAITYQSFKARSPETFDFHPYLLKEFRNRWFLVGSKQNRDDVINLALDRMLKIEHSKHNYRINTDFDPTTYFKNNIGVSTHPNLKIDEVILFVTHKHAPYVETKPFHSSQKRIDKDYYGVTFSLSVQHNFELEKEILALGDGVRVIAPQRLKERIKSRLEGGLDLYNTVLNPKNISNKIAQLNYKGTAVQNGIYTKREINKIGNLIKKYFEKERTKVKKVHALRELLIAIPKLIPLLFNKNLQLFIDEINPAASLTKSIFFNKTEDANWLVAPHQDIAINVKPASNKKAVKSIWKKKKEGYFGWTEKKEIVSVCPPEEISKNRFTIRIHLDDTTAENGAVSVITGTHQKQLSSTEIETITSNAIPTVQEVKAGGIHLMKPLILHSSKKSKVKKARKVIHLEFASNSLYAGLEWSEKIEKDEWKFEFE